MFRKRNQGIRVADDDLFPSVENENPGQLVGDDIGWLAGSTSFRDTDRVGRDPMVIVTGLTYLKMLRQPG
jgi:hypothetical protein